MKGHAIQNKQHHNPNSLNEQLIGSFPENLSQHMAAAHTQISKWQDNPQKESTATTVPAESCGPTKKAEHHVDKDQRTDFQNPKGNQSKSRLNQNPIANTFNEPQMRRTLATPANLAIEPDTSRTRGQTSGGDDVIDQLVSHPMPE